MKRGSTTHKIIKIIGLGLIFIINGLYAFSVISAGFAFLLNVIIFMVAIIKISISIAQKVKLKNMKR